MNSRLVMWMPFFLLAACSSPPDGGTTSNMSLNEAFHLGDTAGFSQAVGPRDFHFPDDHGAHPGFKIEWWYFNGNLYNDRQRRFAYHLTFFRVALKPSTVPQERNKNQIYMAHFAITDPVDGAFHYRQRLGRDLFAVAGSEKNRLGVWLDNWQVKQSDAEGLSIQLKARDKGMGLDLTLRAVKAPVLQGQQGLSQKGPGPGNASYYYSMTRLETSGSVVVGDRTHRVTGQSWMDHEWFSQPPGSKPKNWDWFALQLDNGEELMYYQLRDSQSGITERSHGALVAAGGEATSLNSEQLQVAVTGHSRLSGSGIRYPISWTIVLPEIDSRLQLSAILDKQETSGIIRYWEGAVDVSGTHRDRPIKGVGFVELTGYGNSGSPPPPD